MITFPCPGCGQKLKVKDELAGKKGKCPHCQQAVPVPAAPVHQAAAASGGKPADARTLPPPATPAAQPGARPRSPSAESEQPTCGGRLPEGATLSPPAAGVNPEHYDFLGPAERPDELGRLGSYRIFKVLGAGGMGVVFLGEDVQLERKLAIKAMLPALAASESARQRFLREAKTAAAIEHDHIVPIFQVGQDRGVPFIAMPFLKGEPLDERLRRQGVLPLAEILRIGRETARGLAAAAQAGLIHRDIKPANLWLEGAEGRVKILDFGLARAAGDNSQLTQTGAIMGTPAYMAPEQARGETVTARCDVFSLGCVLYKMSTGLQPFKGTDPVSTLMAVAMEQPIPPLELNPGIPRELSDLVMKLLEKDPDRRPASAAEVVRTLEVLQGKPALATPIAPVAPGPNANPWEDITESEPVHTPMATPAVKAKRGRTPLLAALGLLALVPLVWWLAVVILRVETANGTLLVEINDAEPEARIKNGKLILTGPDGKVRYTLSLSERNKKIDAGPYKIRVEGADGLRLDTREFTLKKDGKVTVRVTVVPRKVANKDTLLTDPDRTAAEWVLSIGGTVCVNGQEQEIKAATDLPKEPFPLTCVNLHQSKQVTDANLAHLKDCKNLTRLDLDYTQVSDAGLAHFKDCTNLSSIQLHTTKVSDAGLAHFKDCTNLSYLNLSQTHVTDAGLAHFKDCKNLTGLVLLETKVSDAGLAHFKDCKNLTSLTLNFTQVSDAGLAYFKDCNNLSFLRLDNTRVSDAGLAYFRDCKNLTYLNLSNTRVGNTGLTYFKDCKNLIELNVANTQVSDAGLAHFKDCKGLAQLDVRKTKVTAAKIEELKKALPRCKIEWDGEPRVSLDPDRKAAEYVLSIGGTVKVNGQGRGIQAAADLPREPFRLTLATLYRNKQVSDAGLANFDGCKNLIMLDLCDTKVSDAGLAYFKDCKNLTLFRVTGQQVSDAGLAHFKGCKRLTHLNLGNTRVSDAGLTLFKDCKNLTILWLQHTQVSDEGLAPFKGCQDLTDLNLAGTKVSDKGLAHFNDCKNLTVLRLQKTKVTAAKIEELKKALPKCKIEWDGEPRVSLDPDRKAAEYVLSIGGTVRVNGQDLTRSISPSSAADSLGKRVPRHLVLGGIRDGAPEPRFLCFGR